MGKEKMLLLIGLKKAQSPLLEGIVDKGRKGI